MSEKQQKFKEELKALFIKNKELFPKIEDDVFDTLLHQSLEVSEGAFMEPICTKEQLVEVTLYFISAATINAMLLSTTYGPDAIEDAEYEAVKRLLGPIYEEFIK